MVHDEEALSAEPDDGDSLEVRMTRAQRVVTATVGVLAGGAGGVAVFETDNGIGSAALITVGLYCLVATVLDSFPRLKLGDSEIDPTARRIARQAQRISLKAEEDAADAKEGLWASVRVRNETLVSPLTDADLDEEVRSLAAEYNQVRWTMPSGRARTRRMTDIADAMIARFRVIGAPASVERLLNDDDRGVRLAGISAMHAAPQTDAISALVRVCVTPDKPFNEYRALLALAHALDGNCPALTAEARAQLTDRLRSLHPDTDRAEEIRGILEACP